MILYFDAVLRHNIIFRCSLKIPDFPDEIKPVVADLETISSFGNVGSILRKLTVKDSIDLCVQQNLAAPGIYPILFNMKHAGRIKKSHLS